MRRALNRVAPILAGVALGLVLLYISSLIQVNESGVVTYWGLPLFWRVAGGAPSFQEACIGQGVSVFGVCLMKSFYTRFVLDLVFWLAFSLIAVEVSARVATRHVREKIEAKGSVSEERVSP